MLASGELNITEIARRSGLSHSSTARHLEFLANSGLIIERRFNRIRIFSVDYSNPFVSTLNHFLSEWKSLSSSLIVQRSFA
jgi:DNA-binding transcriptional ArsR family regulator